jgi:glycerol-3-phosphate dehydrogenase
MLTQCGYSANEIRFIIEREHVECLADLFLRRTTIAIAGGLSLDLIDEVSNIMALQKGWDATKASAERLDFLSLLEYRHGIDLSNLSRIHDKRSALCA